MAALVVISNPANTNSTCYPLDPKLYCIFKFADETELQNIKYGYTQLRLGNTENSTKYFENNMIILSYKILYYIHLKCGLYLEELKKLEYLLFCLGLRTVELKKQIECDYNCLQPISPIEDLFAPEICVAPPHNILF